MAKQNITVKIIGKPYPLAIDGEKEELYRLAEREINAYVTRIEQAHFKGFSKEVKTLAALGGELESYLDALR